MVRRLSSVVPISAIVCALFLGAPAVAQTKKLGTFGGWAVSQEYANGKFVRCTADTTGSTQNEGLRFSFYPDGKRYFSVPGPGTPNGTRDKATVVLQPSGKRFSFNMNQSNPNRLWSGNLLTAFTDVLFQSKRMEVLVPEHNLKRVFNLGDPEDMTAAIDGCVTSNQSQAEATPAAPAGAQARQGDANFCRQYAAAASAAAQDAIARNPSCQDFSKGVHADTQNHFNWCSRTPREEVEGASTHIRRLASRCTQGALAAPTDYGGYNIVDNDKFERPFGTAGKWDVRAASSGQTFMYCVAVSNVDGRKVRLGVDVVQPGATGQWQLAVPMRSSKEWQGTFQVDGRGFGNGGANQASGVGVGGWSIVWLGAAEVDGMKKGGREGLVGVGTLDYDFSLEGVAAAIRKIEECRSRKGATG